MKFYPRSSYVLVLAAGGFRCVFRCSIPPLAVASDGATSPFAVARRLLLSPPL